VNSLPKTVTQHRRDCDLNPGPSAPESSTLTTWLPSHPAIYELNGAQQNVYVCNTTLKLRLNSVCYHYKEVWTVGILTWISSHCALADGPNFLKFSYLVYCWTICKYNKLPRLLVFCHKHATAGVSDHYCNFFVYQHFLMVIRQLKLFFCFFW